MILKIIIDILLLLIAYEIGISVGKKKGLKECEELGDCSACLEDAHLNGWNAGVSHVLDMQKREREFLSHTAEKQLKDAKPKKVAKKKVSKKGK